MVKGASPTFLPLNQNSTRHFPARLKLPPESLPHEEETNFDSSSAETESGSWKV